MTPWGWRARSIAKWTIVAVVVLGAGALFVFSTYFVAGQRQAALIPTKQLKIGDCIQQWWSSS
ncbi:MAG: hypothetical protein QOD39_876, partial [Mycobacterium sp.]|nr:hypothetical protein [Mycobacterium sp.]